MSYIFLCQAMGREVPVPLPRPEQSYECSVWAKEPKWCPNSTTEKECSVAKSCSTLCDPMDCSTPGSSVLHYLSKFAQIHVHCVGDAIYLISSSYFSFCLQSFLALGSFPMSWLLCLTVCLYHTILIIATLQHIFK